MAEIQSRLKKTLGQLKKNRLEVMLMLLILLGAAFLRLYRISDYMTFLGDEGRDVLVVKRMIVDHKWTLLGPTASVGGFFLGPIYYYLMLPFLWLFKLDPVGPAVMVALFGVATTFLIYFTGKNFFSLKAGILAAIFYSVSPLMIAYDRSSWNPNIMPFFSLLSLYWLWLTVTRNDRRFLILVGMCLGIAFQLHYLAVFLAVIIFIYLVVFLRGWQLLKGYFLVVIGFIVTFSPFILFELRHRFPNFRSLYRFIFFGKETGVAVGQALPKLGEVVFRLFSRLVANDKTPANWVILILALGVFGFYLLRSWQKKQMKTAFLFGLWLFLGITLFAFYRKDIYDHYLGFMYPLPFLLVGQGLARLSRFKFYGRLAAAGLVVWLLGVNLDGVPFRFEPNRQLLQTKKVTRLILEKARGQPFNFALVTGQNSDHAYRYFLEIWGNKPVVIENPQVDPERKTVTDQLFVVCETQVCQPLGNSLWEIAGFGRADIVSEWKVAVIKIYKLQHWQGE